MTKQEYYQLLVQAVEEKKLPSRGKMGNPICFYRGEQAGTCCAVGLLIQDSRYSRDMEYHNVTELRWEHGDNIIDLPEGVSFDQMLSIQAQHDNRVSYVSGKPDWDGEAFLAGVRQILQL